MMKYMEVQVEIREAVNVAIVTRTVQNGGELTSYHNGHH